MLPRQTLLTAALTAFSIAAIQVPAEAQTIRDNAGFASNTLAANDDGSTGLVGTGFSFNFFGAQGNQLYVNNNGNVTFDAPLSTFTPFNLVSTTRLILAPFFADVDTRGAGSGLTQYGTSMVDGRNAFGVNWLNVGYFNRGTDKLNSFQLVMIDRGDIAAGDFDFEFNYGSIQWETGGASGGVNGLGGSCARAGWSNGSNASFEIAGSAVCGAFLDGGSNMLSRGSNVNRPGRFLFEVRNGLVNEVPEPASIALIGLGLLGLGLRARRRLA